ncbi:C-X-C chemokine receptor type 4-like [Polypterus senegalus]|uniref:C-X-C chemokine receptor type 4-like n=1 Tax=Polypterus senegalus TaxID=55291 RepID=UPI00196662D7|nr:C-X-C chemokine receptor type 4-like [Polypterus senegalus]
MEGAYDGVLEVDFSIENMTDESGSGYEIDYKLPCESSGYSDFKQIFLPVIYSVIFIMGIFGNGLVIIVMGYQKKSKTMTDKYRLHLSVADLLFVLSLPFWAAYAASSWHFGGVLCKMVHSIYTVNLYSSVLILAFISLDRYMAVVHATSSQELRMLLADRVIYIGAWLPALILTVPDLVFASVHNSDGRVVCEHVYPPASSLTWNIVFRFQHIIVGLLMPGLVILSCYCVIILKLSQGSKGVQKRKALKTTVFLIIAFFSCWLPYCIGIFIDALMMLNVIKHSCHLEDVLSMWIMITEPLAYFHCCLNPILYAFLGAKFKKSARNALSFSRGSSLKMLSKQKRTGLSSVSTESESSSFHSS